MLILEILTTRIVKGVLATRCSLIPLFFLSFFLPGFLFALRILEVTYYWFDIREAHFILLLLA